MSKRVQGDVKWFNHVKRYGFIERRDGEEDVFVHQKDFRDRFDAHWVSEGDKVGFNVVEAPKGPKAVDVVVLEAG